MSGVIDSNGQQWEHCNECGGWAKLQDLGYQPHSLKWNGPCDICMDCANKAPNLPDIQPAPSWLPQYGEAL